MKIWLDDLRPAPEGWTWVKWPAEAEQLLVKDGCTVISLDHDLGNDDRGTGYDVLLWIEQAVVEQGFVPPEIRVHTANVSARQKMEAAVRAIESRVAQSEICRR